MGTNTVWGVLILESTKSQVHIKTEKGHQVQKSKGKNYFLYLILEKKLQSHSSKLWNRSLSPRVTTLQYHIISNLECYNHGYGKWQ